MIVRAHLASKGSGPDVVAKAQPLRRKMHALVLLLLVCAGLGLLVYPLAGTYLRNVHQESVVEAYRNSQTQLVPGLQEEWLDMARRYNDTNAGAPILDPWLNRVSKNNAPYRDYVEQLNPEGKPDAVMAALAIPAINSKLPIYHGTEEDTLERGVGHLYGSALPVGGDGMHSVLTGHTGLTTATLFDRLNEVKVGDAFYVSVMGETLKYEVDHTTVVLPHETEYLRPEVGKDYVTLITCTPYGVNSHRLLVRGTRVEMDPEEAERAFAESANPWVWWMWLVAALIVLVLAIITVLAVRNLQARRQGRHALRRDVS